MAKAEDETIGERIARLRRKKGLTQIDLARRLRVSQPVVSGYENNITGLDGAQRITQLAEILGVSSDELLGLLKPPQGATEPALRRSFYRRLQSIDRLPRRDQEALMRTIDAFLSRAV